MRTAADAKQIVKIEGGTGPQVDEAFVAGMLHDTGKLVLVANFDAQYAEALQLARDEKRDLCDAEQQVFGATHADVGGYLLGLWGLPVPVVEAIGLHHTPSCSAKRSFSTLTAVHVAEVWEEENSNEEGIVPALLDSIYIEALGLQDRLAVWHEALRQPVLEEANA
jgi:HD-like signal output (HDOD) protein